MSIDLAEIKLWGRTIGAVSLNSKSEYTSFEYDANFLKSGIQVSPIMIPLPRGIFRFPQLSLNSFHGLPGVLADSLPDKFGNAIIDAWLVSHGRSPDSFNSLERLCYTGTRGMGALEFFPLLGPQSKTTKKLEVAALVDLASEILTHRKKLKTSFIKKRALFNDILRISGSAGGAGAKALIAWNPTTHEVCSGQIKAGDGFEYWLMKFDGVENNSDKENSDPKGYGTIEYAYYLMATAAGITMSECRLEKEDGRHHFMTRRFDRLPNGEKLHMQSLGGLAHFDFNIAGAYSYEQAFAIMRELELPTLSLEQQFRRMAFNIIARNHDDHVKNIAFLMDKSGTWSLSPAFDVTYSFNPRGLWTGMHQMTMNGKREGFTLDDFRRCGQHALLKRGKAKEILHDISNIVKRWPTFARTAGVNKTWEKEIRKNHLFSF